MISIVADDLEDGKDVVETHPARKVLETWEMVDRGKSDVQIGHAPKLYISRGRDSQVA